MDQRFVRRFTPFVVADFRVGGTHFRFVERRDNLVDLVRHAGGTFRRNTRLDDAQHDRLHAFPHRVEKGPKALAYTLLVSAWIATEYWYTVGEFSWPWLILGNGFSHDVRLVQWYEYTGVFGGSLWVLVCNILIYEALQARRAAGKWIAAACAVFVPMIVSLVIYARWQEPVEKITVSLVQPNVDCYDKFAGTEVEQK